MGGGGAEDEIIADPAAVADAAEHTAVVDSPVEAKTYSLRNQQVSCFL